MFANANIRLIIDIAKELFYFFSHKCHASNQPRKYRIILYPSLSERRLETGVWGKSMTTADAAPRREVRCASFKKNIH